MFDMLQFQRKIQWCGFWCLNEKVLEKAAATAPWERMWLPSLNSGWDLTKVTKAVTNEQA
ncbi:hypothetical protein HDU67_002095 [Dinochytrium kinnereticum]|nr:hypothetical protein HDU67_002095 [Dinochytrium kinnereticum]